MLNSKERAKLRAIASTLDASTIIGINGVTENVIEQIKMDFSNKELCKVKVLPNCGNVVKDCMNEIAVATASQPVCTIGNYFVLYKVNSKKGFKHLLIGE